MSTKQAAAQKLNLTSASGGSPLGNLKEAWKQLIAVIGQPTLKLAIPVIQSMTAALQRLTEYANAAWQALSKVFGWEQVDAISAATDSEKELTKAVEATTEAQEGALAGFDEIQVLTDKSAGNASADSAVKAVEALTETDQTSGGVLTPAIDTSKLEEGITWIRSTFESAGSPRGQTSGLGCADSIITVLSGGIQE